MTYPSIRKSVLSVAVATSIFCGAAAQAELEEVMVTAQKRSQSLADVPMSVSALTADNLNDAGIQTMDDVTRQIPVLEVQTNTSAAATTFRIRRVGNLGNIPSFEPAVAVFIDGAFRGRSIFGASDMFDVERIEILYSGDPRARSMVRMPPRASLVSIPPHLVMPLNGRVR
jgi:outer membrane receptor protein involved in Fe transport